MKTAISIPDRIFEEAEAFARGRGLSRSELYVKAVTQYIKLERGDDVTDQLNALYGQDEDHGRLDPFLRRLPGRVFGTEK
jgi:hypothetical protein